MPPRARYAPFSALPPGEIRSLGKTLSSWSSWRTDIIAHHRTGASNGPTEALTLSVKQVKR